MSREIFSSELGDVNLLPDRIKRKSRSGDWQRITKEFKGSTLIDSANFEEIQEVGLNQGSYYTVLKLKIGDEWKRMFFRASDNATELFNNLKYKLNVYRENH